MEHDVVAQEGFVKMLQGAGWLCAVHPMAMLLEYPFGPVSFSLESLKDCHESFFWGKKLHSAHSYFLGPCFAFFTPSHWTVHVSIASNTCQPLQTT